MTRGLRSATITSKSQSDTNAEFLDAGERAGFTVYNDSEVVLYLALGSAAASATNFTISIAAGGYYEGPWGYDGPVQGVFASAGAGAARITDNPRLMPYFKPPGGGTPEEHDHSGETLEPSVFVLPSYTIGTDAAGELRVPENAQPPIVLSDGADTHMFYPSDDTDPADLASGDTADPGSAEKVAKVDHVHGMPTIPAELDDLSDANTTGYSDEDLLQMDASFVAGAAISNAGASTIGHWAIAYLDNNKGYFNTGGRGGFDYGSGIQKRCSKVRIVCNGGDAITSFSAQYSDDGNSWTTLQTWSGLPFRSDWTYEFDDKSESHRYWACYFNGVAGECRIDLMQFYQSDSNAEWMPSSVADVLGAGVDLSGGSEGDLATQQADGSFAAETPAFASDTHDHDGDYSALAHSHELELSDLDDADTAGYDDDDLFQMDATFSVGAAIDQSGVSESGTAQWLSCKDIAGTTEFDNGETSVFDFGEAVMLARVGLTHNTGSDTIYTFQVHVSPNNADWTLVGTFNPSGSPSYHTFDSLSHSGRYWRFTVTSHAGHGKVQLVQYYETDVTAKWKPSSVADVLGAGVDLSGGSTGHAVVQQSDGSFAPEAEEASLGAFFPAPAADDQFAMVVPFDCTIVKADMLADTSESCVVDVWVDDRVNHPPTDADSITASAPMTLSTASSSEDSTLTGWTTSLTKGQVIIFNVDSVGSPDWVTAQLQVEKA